MTASDSRGGGAAGRIRVAAKLARDLADPAQELLQLSEQNTREVEIVDAMMSVVLDEIERNIPTDVDERKQALELFDSVDEMVATSAQATEVFRGLSVSLDGAARATRTLRPTAREIQRGLRGMADAQAIYDAWPPGTAN